MTESILKHLTIPNYGVCPECGEKKILKDGVCDECRAKIAYEVIQEIKKKEVVR